MRLANTIGAAAIGLALTLSASAASAQDNAQPAACPPAARLDAAPQLVRAGDAAAIADFRQSAPCHYWITFYFAAESLFKSGERDEAVRWFYVGQLRGRTVARLDPASTPALIQALQFAVGQSINEYAGGDRGKFLAAIDWAIDWDRRHPMQLTSIRRVGHHEFGATELDFSPDHPLAVEVIRPAISQAQLDAAYADQRQGIAGLREMIAAVSPEEWARQRRQNGLN